MSQFSIRSWQPSDLAELHRINEGAVPGVGSVPRDVFDRLVAVDGALTLVVEWTAERRMADAAPVAPAGFVLCMTEGLNYASLNYRWLSQRYERFAYVDRIAVVDGARGRGLGDALYAAVFTHFADVRDVLLAEVNLAPPNPGSMRFHKRLGFCEVGQRWENEGAKGVAYLEKRL